MKNDGVIVNPEDDREEAEDVIEDNRLREGSGDDEEGVGLERALTKLSKTDDDGVWYIDNPVELPVRDE